MRRRRPRALVVGVLCLATLGGCRHADVGTVESFRAAREAGDIEAARAYLSDDPRVWYEKREGPGGVWNLDAGRWKAWDDHFNSTSDLSPWQRQDDSVWAIAEEWNDYYRLIERESISRYRITYFFEPDDRIGGYMISDAYPDRPDPPAVSRFDEIEAWAVENHPDEWAYLRPGGRLDPTGDRAERTRALINRWRIEVGLTPVD